jgi:hypothetical protein
MAGGEIGKRLDVGGAQQWLVRVRLAPYPFALESLCVLGREQPVLPAALALGVGELRQEHDERQ